MTEIPRMRTVPLAFKEFKQLDPYTSVTENHLRMLVLSGKIPHISIGRKRLVDVNKIISYFADDTPQPLADQDPQIGAIRQIKG